MPVRDSSFIPSLSRFGVVVVVAAVAVWWVRRRRRQASRSASRPSSRRGEVTLLPAVTSPEGRGARKRSPGGASTAQA
ncbi:hypothetical protein [Pyxidicoccus xibeiensis]|uniref:hypothetical protein n=1 Tax=Pyxidicoccus xibeiensis TaxID=2906759 RepID=UPI0020A6EDCA|nr:hypothetical protein [Pyxidicoccus xibeiensis]MCP3140882.1 hypothetical protein [Pyxidicoccus xibeiensis]